MKDDGDIADSTIEILSRDSHISVDESYVIRRNPTQDTRFPNETPNSPAVSDKRLDYVTPNEATRARNERDFRPFDVTTINPFQVAR